MLQVLRCLLLTEAALDLCCAKTQEISIMAAIRITEITDKGKPLRSSAVCLFFLIKLN